MIHSIVMSLWLTLKFLIFAGFMAGSICGGLAGCVFVLKECRGFRVKLLTLPWAFYVVFVIVSASSNAVWFAAFEAWARKGIGE